MSDKNYDFYANNIDQCVNQYENLTFQQVHGDIVESNIKENGRVLDIGCGTGRDAYYLASTGRKVVAIDPVKEMIEYAQSNNSHENIDYQKDSLPELKNVKGKFDFVLLSAVWMHLDEKVQKKSLKKLKKILNKDGKMMILIRNGGFSDGRESHPFLEKDKFNQLSKELGLSSEIISGTKEDLLNRKEVSWTKLLITNNNKPTNKLKR